MKLKFIKLEYLLEGLIVLLFVGGFFFVVYEPEMVPPRSIQENGEQNSSVINKSRASAVERPKKVVAAEKIDKTPPPKKIYPEKSKRVVAPLSSAADFGVEGAVFALTEGVPLKECKVSFNGESMLTDQSGEFHLWLEGEVGRLSFSCPGFKTLEIQQFDVRSGGGLARFDVYLNGIKKVGKGRIETNGVNGRVYNRESGAPLAGARITLGSLRAVADDAGFFELWGNNSGLMTMTVSASGYVSEMFSGIDFENRNNPFFFEVPLERNQEGKGRLALVGIGARLVKSEMGYEVADVLVDSPAALEGLITGDRLVAVDSLAVDDFSLREVVELIRGQVGFSVTLMVEREGDFLEFICQRARVVY